MRTITALPNARIPLGRQGENEAARVVWPGIAEKYRTLYGDGVFALGVQRSDETEAHPAALTREGDDLIWVVTAEDTAAAGIGRAELQYLVGETVAKSQTWTTEAYRALAPIAPSGEPGAAWYAAVQAQIGDLNALTTRAKDNLVAAINEAAKSGGGGTAAEVEMRVEDGYIQYTSDGGGTWENLIALEELKGEDGKDGEPGKDGAAGSPGADGYSPSAKVEQTATGATITITDKDGTTTASVTNGKDGAPGAKGEKGEKGDKGDTGATGATGAQGDPGEDYTLTEDDKSEIAALAAALVPSGGGGINNGRWELIREITLTPETPEAIFDSDNAGNTLSVAELLVIIPNPSFSGGYIYFRGDSSHNVSDNVSIWTASGKCTVVNIGILNGKIGIISAQRSDGSVGYGSVQGGGSGDYDAIQQLLVGFSAGVTADTTIYVYGR